MQIYLKIESTATNNEFHVVLHQMVITKDNLVKIGMIIKIVVFVTKRKKTIVHLFISCPFAQIITLMHSSHDFYISPPTNITNLFGSWYY